MFLLKPPMCNSSLLTIRKEKAVKATHWRSRPVKGKGGHSPAVRRRAAPQAPEGTRWDTGPYTQWELIHLGHMN